MRCQNLATKALALAKRRLANDWQVRYGYKPVLLETFVDQRFHGTCYKAGNWLNVGLTQVGAGWTEVTRTTSPSKASG